MKTKGVGTETNNYEIIKVKGFRKNYNKLHFLFSRSWKMKFISRIKKSENLSWKSSARRRK